MAKSAKTTKKTAKKTPTKRATTTAKRSAKKKATPKKDKASPTKDEANIDRRRGDRRQEDEPVAVERRKLERREKTPRRRQIDPTTCERDYSNDEIEFMNALDEYKRKNGRMFPTCSEVLEVIRDLGYRKHTEAPAPASPEEQPAVADSATDNQTNELVAEHAN